MLPHHTIATTHVHGILMGARHRGLDTTRLLALAAIPAALLESPLTRISQRQYALLIRALRRELRDELWGLLSHPLPPGSFGQGMRQLVRCTTLGEALREGCVWCHLLLKDFVPRLSVRDGRAHVQFMLTRISDARLDYGVKAFMLLAFNAFSWLVARRIPLLRVDYTAEQTNTETSGVYQVPIRHGQPHIGLSFDARWLDLPVVQSPQSLREFLADSPGNLIVKYRDASSLAERIRRLLRKRLGHDMPSLEEVGEVLAITPQAVRRRLRDEGRGFQRIKDELRRDAAIEFMLHTKLPLIDVANRVGFSEASTFHRAFKQWTGVAPGEYRLSHGAAR